MSNIKIAVTYDEGEIFQHFGHTKCFKLYIVKDKEVENTIILDTNGSGHGALSTLLQQEGVTHLICGGIGGGAQQALADADITLFGGVSGNADEAVSSFLEGKLVFNPNASCSGHGSGEHEASGHCGGHCHE